MIDDVVACPEKHVLKTRFDSQLPIYLGLRTGADLSAGHLAAEKLMGPNTLRAALVGGLNTLAMVARKQGANSGTT